MRADPAYRTRQLVRATSPSPSSGLGSNLIVRDGGVLGVVIRLGRGFNEVEIGPDNRVRAGTAVPDLRAAKAAQEAGIAGLAFMRGIPGARSAARCA